MKIASLFVFIMIRGDDEKMVMYPNDEGVNVPLMYASHDTVSEKFMRTIVQEMADEGKSIFELREYTINEKAVEVFYPVNTRFI